VIDEHILPLPADLAAGTYHLVAGMYDEPTNSRLPVYDDRGTNCRTIASQLRMFTWTRHLQQVSLCSNSTTGSMYHCSPWLRETQGLTLKKQRRKRRCIHQLQTRPDLSSSACRPARTFSLASIACAASNNVKFGMFQVVGSIRGATLGRLEPGAGTFQSQLLEGGQALSRAAATSARKATATAIHAHAVLSDAAGTSSGRPTAGRRGVRGRGVPLRAERQASGP